jgi:nitrite reductase (NAD(P)H)
MTTQVTNIFNAEMKKAGHELNNHLCSHFALSRADLFNIVRVKKLRNFTQIMQDVGVSKDSIGCELCKPAIGSILSSM